MSEQTSETLWPSSKAGPTCRRFAWKVIPIAWSVAFFEYCFQVPANRMGYQAGAQAGQLKIIQEVITLVVFVIFARIVLGEKLAWNYYVAFALILAAVFFVFAFRQEPPHA